MEGKGSGMTDICCFHNSTRQLIFYHDNPIKLPKIYTMELLFNKVYLISLVITQQLWSINHNFRSILRNSF